MLMSGTTRGWAAEPGPAGAFVVQLGRELPSVIGDAATEAEKRRRLSGFLARVVDVEAVARFCMGRYWRLATPAQQTEYRSLFLLVLAGGLASRVGIYGAATATTVTMLPEIAKPDGVHVPTVVRTAGEPPVRVTWVVDTGTRPFHVLDVQAEGLSMRLALRGDHTSFLNQHAGNIDLFLRTLRERTR